MPAPESSLPAAPRRFSVIVPVFNAAPYLDRLFTSIVEQTLGFESRIDLIVVDDGSTDQSSVILRRWRRKYPNNIAVVRKQNGGLSSARNAALLRAQNDWITFIDADDFVARDYFSVADETIDRYAGENLVAVVGKTIQYIEATGEDSDSHPLRERFDNGERALRVRSIGRNYQVTVIGAFLRRELITNGGLSFDEQLTTGSEDAHFLGRYLLQAPDGLFVLQPSAKYNHRVRAAGTSITQQAWHQPASYDDELRLAHLDLLRRARVQSDSVPEYIQNMVLYCLSWNLMRGFDNPSAVSFLNRAQQRTYLALLGEILEYINTETILAFRLLSRPVKVALLGRFKNAVPDALIITADRVDRAKSQTRFSFWSHRSSAKLAFQIDGGEVIPAFTKLRAVPLFSEVLLYEHIVWISHPRQGQLRASVDGLPARLLLGDREFADGLPLEELASVTERVNEFLLPEPIRKFRRAARSAQMADVFGGAWLFIDRDMDADDSAEHLYRYVQAHAPKTKAFFILSQKSQHWERLRKDGFQLIGFNTPHHVAALLNAKYLISSQADHYVIGNLPAHLFGDLIRYKFVFLQHGVTQADYSDWFNRLPVDCLVTTTLAEHESIVGDGTNYRLTRKEAVLAGLPRHDALLSGPVTDDRIVVVMPTWRSWLSGAPLGPGNARSPVAGFSDSEFATRWRSLLSNPRLAALVERTGHRVAFVPHPNTRQYLDQFGLPMNVEIRTFEDGGSVQQLFRSLSLLVTDFSSKAFDAALLDKPVVYYQFDRDRFFGGNHTGRPGYFDFERDGFGPVVFDEDAAIDAIAAAIENAADVEATYRNRAVTAFPFRDGGSCARVYEAILRMEGDVASAQRA